MSRPIAVNPSLWASPIGRARTHERIEYGQVCKVMRPDKTPWAGHRPRAASHREECRETPSRGVSPTIYERDKWDDGLPFASSHALRAATGTRTGRHPFRSGAGYSSVVSSSASGISDRTGMVPHGDLVCGETLSVARPETRAHGRPWVRHLLGNQLVSLEVERVADNQLGRFASAKLAHLDELAVGVASAGGSASAGALRLRPGGKGSARRTFSGRGSGCHRSCQSP